MSRALEDLCPEVRAKVQLLCLRARAELGVELVIVWTLRTDEEQEALYAKGRSRPGPKVTNARAGQSWHNPCCPEGHARAVDVAFREGTHGVSWNGPWAYVGQIGREVGLAWGGDWPRKKRDRPHFEDRGGLTIVQARASYLDAQAGPVAVG